MRKPSLLVLAFAAFAPTLGCGTDETQNSNVADDTETLTKAGDGKFDSSVEALFLDFEFDGELVTDSSFNLNAKIQDQLFYTIGHLNGERGVGRLDKAVLSNVVRTTENGAITVRYHARLPVAWNRRNPVPMDYTFHLPRDVSFAGTTAFTEKYMHSCVDFGAHDVTSGNMWYYYRPERSGCALDAADIVSLDARVSRSTIGTTGKFPEYDKIWEDNRFEGVAVFGKNEDGVTSNSDVGISAYNRFIAGLKTQFAQNAIVTTPAVVPNNPGVAMPDVTVEATLAGGRKVKIVVLLVDNVRTAGPVFDARYASLTPTADYIAYNGHAGLGANIRALANKGTWKRGQYALAFVNGCDTYTYIGGALNQAHYAVNPDDPEGTKYFDIMTNAMPAFFSSLSPSNLGIIRALVDFEEPLTFEQIFASIDPSQVVVVTGEHDNVFVPGGGGGEPEPWEGLEESGSVTRNQETRFTTPTLQAGTYVFAMTGTRDADLYVRIGQAPSTSLWDCRPYKTGSSETCEVSINTPAPIHIMVRGFSTSSSTFTLSGSAR